MGGVLFIDEAYSINSSDNYSSECISTLIKAMEDHRDNLCVILAGYPKDMEKLIEANKGFQSRIQFNIEFEISELVSEIISKYGNLKKSIAEKISAEV